MKITMADGMGSILSNLTQNNQPETEILEMAENVEASTESNSVELVSDDLCSEKDIPELPSEECAALDNISEHFSDALATHDPEDVHVGPPQEDVVAEETQTEECTLVAQEDKSGSRKVNGETAVAEKVETAAQQGAKVAREEVARNMEEKAPKETKKEGKKMKKGKDAEHMSRAIMQALNGLETPEEKIAALCKKYAELLGEHKSLQRESKSQTKQLNQIQRERDHLQSEHGRALLAKSKLESLCRELQRHNKTIKEESLQRAREEDEKRKEISNKFQQTINEITTQMQENHTRNIKLKEENIELASKLKNLVEQYERREEHIEKLFKHKDLESQLYDAKLQQSNLALTEEKERNKREKEILLTESVDSKRKLEMLTKQEAQLKAQLAVYTEKFEEFQSTLTKSNEVFQTFKQEMDKMTKKIKKLEKETNMWRVRWENSNKSLMSMVEEKARHEKEMLDRQVKISRLEKLCRALQAERNALIGKARSLQGEEAPPSQGEEEQSSQGEGVLSQGDAVRSSQGEDERSLQSKEARSSQGEEARSVQCEEASLSQGETQGASPTAKPSDFVSNSVPGPSCNGEIIRGTQPGKGTSLTAPSTEGEKEGGSLQSSPVAATEAKSGQEEGIYANRDDVEGDGMVEEREGKRREDVEMKEWIRADNEKAIDEVQAPPNDEKVPVTESQNTSPGGDTVIIAAAEV